MYATVIGDRNATSIHGELQKIFGGFPRMELLLETKLEKRSAENFKL